MEVDENIFKMIYGTTPGNQVGNGLFGKGFNNEKAPVIEKAEETRERSLNIIKAFNVIKTVIWESSIHKSSSGEDIDTDNQIVDVKDLLHKCREINQILQIHKKKLDDGVFNEKRILMRFNAIHTKQVIDNMQESIWDDKVE